MTKKAFLFSFILLLGLSAPSWSCTIIMVTDGNVCLVGSNEDSVYPLTKMWFVPATENEYARVCVGYMMDYNSCQGGMNEKGLFVDGNSLSKQNWIKDENKGSTYVPLLDHLLASCADISEVKEYFNSHNTPELDRARIPVMDRSGASMIVEWYNGEVVFLETDKQYQISTNFIESKYIGKEKPCWRYNAATKLLDTVHSFDIPILREALDITHLEHETSTTVFSIICDLKSLDFYVYNFRDFTHELKFNLKEEIGKGKHEFYFRELFTANNPEYEKFILNGPMKMVKRGYRSSYVNALIYYRILKKNYPDAFQMEIDIDLLSDFSRELIGDGKLEDAIIFLKRNAKEFSDSDRAWFELANAYLANDDKEKARDAYEKTLEINPEQIQAREALDALIRE